MTSVQDSKKVLVATVATPTFDQYAALYAIATSIKNFSTKEVHVGVANKIADKFTSSLSLGDIKVFAKLPPKKFLLEFKNQKNKVKAIQWNQENELLKFFLTMESGNFQEIAPTLKTLGSDYESIVIIGVNNFTEMGALYSEAKDIFQDATISMVGGEAKDEKLKVTQEHDDKHLSICEDAYYFMQKNNLKIDQKIASALLAGVFFATKNFKKNLNDAKTFITSAELMKKGATNEEAQRLVDAVKTDGSKPQANSQKPGGSSSNSNQSQNQNQNQNQGQNKPQQSSNSSQSNQQSGYKPMQNVSSNAPQRVDF